MSHKGKFIWIPAETAWHLVCTECGEEFPNSIESVEFEIPGDCEPGDILGIEVKEDIGVKDVYGGVD